MVEVRIDLFIHNETGSVDRKLDRILTQLRAVRAQGATEMASLTEVQARVEALRASVENETNTKDGIVRLLEGQTAEVATLRRQLADAIAAGADPAALQAIVDSLSAIEETNTRNAQALADAVLANTPAAP